MKIIITKCIFILITIALSGCATYSKQECTNFNWDKRGYISALNGNVKENGLLHYYERCNDKYGIKPQDELFSTGYARGLKVFCTPDHARKFADKGGEYVGICPEEKEKAFMKPYLKGVNKFYKNKVDELESKISSMESEISSLESDKARLENELSSCRSGF